jgi:hypothetical protein
MSDMVDTHESWDAKKRRLSPLPRSLPKAVPAQPRLNGRLMTGLRPEGTGKGAECRSTEKWTVKRVDVMVAYEMSKNIGTQYTPSLHSPSSTLNPLTLACPLARPEGARKKRRPDTRPVSHADRNLRHLNSSTERRSEMEAT